MLAGACRGVCVHASSIHCRRRFESVETIIRRWEVYRHDFRDFLVVSALARGTSEEPVFVVRCKVLFTCVRFKSPTM